jgi:hypothetical protein
VILYDRQTKSSWYARKKAWIDRQAQEVARQRVEHSLTWSMADIPAAVVTQGNSHVVSVGAGGLET